MKNNKPYVVALGICKNEEKNLVRWYEDDYCSYGIRKMDSEKEGAE